MSTCGGLLKKEISCEFEEEIMRKIPWPKERLLIYAQFFQKSIQV